MGRQYKEVQQYVHDAANRNPCHNLTFMSQRKEDQFKATSTEMIRVADLVGQLSGKPAPNYEHTCMQEYTSGGG